VGEQLAQSYCEGNGAAAILPSQFGLIPKFDQSRRSRRSLTSTPQQDKRLGGARISGDDIPLRGSSAEVRR
jgi:hypothetical protein